MNRALLSARDTASLANELYQKSPSSYLDLVDAQRASLQAERQETQLRGQRAVSTILLAKALGGGSERDTTTLPERSRNYYRCIAKLPRWQRCALARRRRDD